MITKQEKFINAAKAIHGDAYDYSKAIFKTTKDKVCIIHLTCGREFWQTPELHVRRKYRCSHCYKSKPVGIEVFIARSRVIHGNEYNYDKVIYKDNNTKVCILHLNCGKEFWQVPDSHMRAGNGCPHCYGAGHLTTEIFIQRAVQIHGNEYDYTKVVYVNNRTPVCLRHKKCGREFWQTPDSHARAGHKCYLCFKRTIMSIDEFIERSIEKHGLEYDYSKVVYITNNTPVCIVHKKCGTENWQRPAGHMDGRGCIKCSGRQTLTQEEFLRRAVEINGDAYDYSKVKYVNIDTHITITHKKCGNEFQQVPYSHLIGYQCAHCVNKAYSKVAIEWLNKVSNFLGIEIKHATNGGEYTLRLVNGKLRKLDGSYEPDFFKIAFEFDGDFWHGNPEVFDPDMINPKTGKKFSDMYKETIRKKQELQKLGWYVVSIWENDYRTGILMYPEDQQHFFLHDYTHPI